MGVIACCRTAVLLLLSAVSFFSLTVQEKKFPVSFVDGADGSLPGTMRVISSLSIASDVKGVLATVLPRGAEYLSSFVSTKQKNWP